MKTRTLHRIAAAIVFIAALTVYLLTVAPTISFWDSGEFITCARIMGVPHPPGAPLLMLMGRVMSVLPFYDFRGYGFEHAAYRVNLIAVLTAALTVMLGYLVTAGLIRRIRPFTGSASDDWPGVFAAAAAALMAAFSHQFWENAVETETYMPSLCFSMLALWLALRWEERKDDPAAVRYLFLASYLVGLGIGIHLTVMLAAPALVLIVLLGKPSWFADRRLWQWLAATFAALVLIRVLGGRQLYYLLMAVLAAGGPFVILKLHRSRRSGRRAVFLAALACLSLSAIGYSVYPTVMVRAAKKPAVNEGNPDTWSRYQDYLERTQYDQGNMYAGMFARKADPGYQFGFMFLRYLLRQYPKWGPSPPVTFVNDRTPGQPGMLAEVQSTVHIPVLLWLIILFGMIFHARRDPARFLPFIAFFLATSVGLVLYLNMENPETRERGYFFLGAFYIVSVWIGIGLFGVLAFLREQAEKRGRKALAMPVTAVTACLLATMVPASLLSAHIDPQYTNYELHDRSRNLIPWEYGYNHLVSCPENAVLFSQGDNDTYPLWYLQEVDGFRTDVRVVNLSILNAPWYIKQLRDEGVTVPIALSDDFIDDRLCGNTLQAQRTLMWTPRPQEVTIAGITWNMPPAVVYPTSDGSGMGILTVSSYMTAHIIGENDWRRPLCFTVSVDPLKLIGLDRFMSTTGMVFRLTKTEADARYHIDEKALEENLYERYRFSGVTDPDVYKSHETKKLLQNYFVGFADLCDRYLQLGEKEKAIRAARAAFENSEPSFGRRVVLYSIMKEGGIEDEVNRMMERELDRLPTDDPVAVVEIGRTFLEYGLNDQAAQVFRRLTGGDPGSVLAWKGLAASLYQAERYDEAARALDRILELSPGDREALRLRDMLNARPGDNR